MFKRFFLALLAASAVLAARPASSAAQKALVYCPTGADAGGCARIATAIAGKFTAVDKAYDGTGGTIDLRTADLAHYAVVVVPSLADAGDHRPYALLRGEAARLKLAVTGRVAVFSGAPDQGAANREAKDAVIANLVAWAAQGHTRPVGLVGLVAFQDLSEDAAARYDWVAQASPVEVSADAELRSFRSVTTQPGARTGLFKKGDAVLAYPNMASYGLHLGKSAPARAISAAVGGDAGQTVLVTYGEPGSSGVTLMASVAGGDTAWITTDKQDYMPGETVTFTGGNWAPGDTVRISLHEDPHWTPEHQDRFVIAVADGQGALTNGTFVVDQHDFGVTFTVTATAIPSGKTAMHTFTDGNPNAASLNPGSVTVTQGGTANFTANVTMGGNGDACTVTFSVSGLPTGATASFSGGASVTTSANISKPFTVATTAATPAGTHPLTVTATRGANCQGNGNLTATGTLVVTASAVDQPTLTAVVPATGVFGSTYPLNTSGGAGTGAVTYGTGASSACTIINGNTLSITSGTGTCAVTATKAASAGFNATSSAPATVTVQKANATINVSGFTGPYDGNAHGATGTAKGVNGEDLNSLLDLGASFTSVPGGSASWSFAGNGNYNATSGTAAVAISQASSTTTVTCSPASVQYTGSAHTPCTVSVTGAGNLSLAPAPTYANNTNVGTATASYTYAGDANHTASSDSKTFAITPVSVTAAITAGDKPYDGTTAVVGAVGCSLTGVLSGDAANVGCTASGAAFDDANAGNRTVSATVALGGSASGNYQLGTTSASVAAKIAQIDATISVTGFTGPYDGDAHGATGTATGVGGADLKSLLSLGASYTNVPGGTATWSFAGNTNYKPAGGSVDVTISQANNAVSFTSTNPGTLEFESTYAAAAGATFGTPALSVSGVCSLTGTTVKMTSGTGACVVTAKVEATGNYKGAEASQTITASKKGAQVSLAGATPTYDGSAKSLTGSTTPANLTLGYTYNGSATAPTNAGTYTVVATIDDANYAGTATATLEIKKASSATTVTCPATEQPYTGDAQTPCTAKATGAGNLNADVAVTHANNLNAGTATANATYAGDDNHTGSSGNGSFTIGKVNATISVSGYTGTYDGNAHGASGSATGVKGETLAGLALGGSFTDVPGGTANWVFTDVTGNYNSTSGSVAITINKADASITVNGYSGTYDGAEHGATGSVTGVKGESLSSLLDLGAKFTNAPGGTASWAFAGNGNYNAASGSAPIVIGRAKQTISWSDPSDVVYGTTLGATQLNAVATGVPNGSATGALTYTPSAGALLAAGTHTLGVAAAQTTNYDAASAEVKITVTPRPITVTPTAGQQKQYGETDPTIAYTASEALLTGNTFAGALDRASGQDVGTYAIGLGTLSAGPNYAVALAAGAVSFTITKAPLTVKADDKSRTYGDENPTLTGTVTGQKYGDTFTATYATAATAASPVASYAIVPDVTGDKLGNYDVTKTNGTLAVTARSITVTADAKTKVYGQADPALTYKVTSGNLVNGDAFAGALTRAAGMDVGTYAIQKGSLTLSANYALAYVGADFEITKAPLVVVTNAATKIQGAPVPTFTGSLQGVQYGDAIPVTYSTTATDMSPPGSYPITAMLGGTKLGNYSVTNAGATLTVTANEAPKVVAVNGPVSPIQLGATAPLTVEISDVDPAASAPYVITVDWGNGVTTTQQASAPGVITITPYQYAATGVYTIRVSVTDKVNTAATGTMTGMYQYAVVYDPKGGFVTGGGWILSPAGAYAANPSLSGKATFGFVSKYEKGQNVPSGNTEFQFQAGNFNFKSSSYEWLVISGQKAQFKGLGTVNGGGSYEFTLTVLDGSPDRFRIRVLDKSRNNEVVYDNQLGGADNSDPTTGLGGGSIQIQQNGK